MSPLYLLGFGVGTTLGLLLAYLGVQRLAIPSGRPRGGAAKGPSDERNAARALLQAGNVGGVLLIAGSLVTGSVVGRSLASDLTWVVAYGVAAIVLFVAFVRLGVLVLIKSRLPAELARGNVAAGLAAGAHAIATGVIVARAVSGTDLHGLGVSAAFFVLAQLSFYVLTTAFR